GINPNIQLTTKESVTYIKSHNIDCICWTVNTPEEMKRAFDFGVDGIITDHPDKGLAFRNNFDINGH
ncbi:MAG: hypothetical protein MRY83_16595, partial [Flavobacteriales bacterium]|nr:hypothetical protein [Flavobacteriales bacterium]